MVCLYNSLPSHFRSIRSWKAPGPRARSQRAEGALANPLSGDGRISFLASGNPGNGMQTIYVGYDSLECYRPHSVLSDHLHRQRSLPKKFGRSFLRLPRAFFGLFYSATARTVLATRRKAASPTSYYTGSPDRSNESRTVYSQGRSSRR